MKIISLSYDEAGYACAIGSAIKRKYNNVTNFFDYLVVDMKTINNILQLKDLNMLLNNFNYEHVNNHKNTVVKWNNFDKLISYHDLKEVYNEIELKNFTKKYMRRYFRLINDIYNEKIIFFIRYGKTSYDEIKNFYNNIKNLNENIICYFINVDYDKSVNNIYYEDIKTYIYINFHAINEPKIYNEDIYFKLLEYNWDFIFNIIEKNNKYYNK
jgi:hypothetical protein